VQITVLIPTLNEAGAIGRTLERLQQLEPPIEVLVVDGFSSDHTGEIAQSYGAQVVFGPGGRGASLKLAELEDACEYVVELALTMLQPGATESPHGLH
jgi:cellulose synthase/poly-beta-1,6-N-acetylglucosamine synthase-like glycosyltransferase